jgi:hypothetical protein
VGGLIKDLNGDGGFDWVIDPERFEVETSVIFPSLTASYNGHALVAPAFAFAGGAGPRLDFDRSLYPAGWNLAVGLSPMGIERGDAFTLEHAVTIMRRDASGGYGEALDNVVLEPQLRSLPKALWGDQGTASGGGADRLVADAMVGFRIKPQARDPQVLRDVDLGPLLYEHNDERRFAATVPAAPATDACAAVAAGNTLSFNLGGLTRPFTNSNYVLSALTAGDAPANRARLLHALVGSGLEIDPDVDLAQAATDILQDWPEIALLGEEK